MADFVCEQIEGRAVGDSREREEEGGGGGGAAGRGAA